MKLHEMKEVLRANPQKQPRIILPDGDTIPGHFHVTEVGHVAKRFIDCGGTLHDTTDTCVLRTYVAGDLDHRLTGEVLATILDLGKQVLPHDDVEVEIEYDCGVVSQFPIAGVTMSIDHINFTLSSKKTDCLAKDKCGIGEDGCGCASGAEDLATRTVAAACC